MKKIFEKYNHQDNLIVISLYPKRGEVYSAGTSGIASYAKNVVSHMNRKVVVLADIPDSSTWKEYFAHLPGVLRPHRPRCFKADMYEEGNVLVYRCFRTNSFLMWFQIIKVLYQFSSIRSVLVQLDFTLYGSVLTTSLILPFLGFLKVLGYKTSVTMHSIVLDVFKLKGHVGLGNGFFDIIKGYFYNLLFHLFYILLGLVSDKIVVLEEVLKQRLNRWLNHGKVISIPHGVDNELNSIPKDKARSILDISQNEYAVLFFGFVNWFKGADCFVDTFKNKEKFLGKKARFIVAGGKSPTLKDKAYYQKYYLEVTKQVQDSKRIEITGYVPQEKIALYFSAADIVVLPYRNLMTASGVLSLVFSYKKPFIVSSGLGEIFEASDFQEAFKSANLRTSDLVFKLNKDSCLKVTEKVLADGLKTKMIKIAEIIREKRAYKNIAILYERVLFSPAITVSEKLALSYSR